ncbi:metal-dependent transcriptional regulator [Candidatus Magnetaquicoccus inordinatus]|uniref:metal-dependent transcriptional regulator n=1 Tax=Candidatus Magnetaquicoccus inordinatus TaxID=2496818 RepID=UPI00102B219F|nr:metal-dependent transcriptional regulator [Candidatus Magnetaquicoccus inordinatus]
MHSCSVPLDELLEMLWRLHERQELTLTALRQADQDHAYEGTLREQAESGMFSVEGENLAFSAAGKSRAEDIVRRHRLAERLIVDVLGKQPAETENAACEFEHLLAPELVNAICTLLGHPALSPRGMPIPQGICCQKREVMIKPALVPLSLMDVGVPTRIASLETDDPERLNRLMALGLLPGTHITLLQRYPAMVVQNEQRQIAFEESVGNDLRVWSTMPTNLGIVAHAFPAV